MGDIGIIEVSSPYVRVVHGCTNYEGVSYKKIQMAGQMHWVTMVTVRIFL